ncbi:hypothetical protein OF83DRAFT_338144 [Amylostereum chailletii]|nr:hypothetical protein OF83DRAFT_338144 [Amylostereum chailletii]
MGKTQRLRSGSARQLRRVGEAVWKHLPSYSSHASYGPILTLLSTVTFVFLLFSLPPTDVLTMHIAMYSGCTTAIATTAGPRTGSPSHLPPRYRHPPNSFDASPDLRLAPIPLPVARPLPPVGDERRTTNDDTYPSRRRRSPQVNSPPSLTTHSPPLHQSQFPHISILGHWQRRRTERGGEKGRQGRRALGRPPRSVPNVPTRLLESAARPCLIRAHRSTSSRRKRPRSKNAKNADFGVLRENRIAGSFLIDARRGRVGTGRVADKCAGGDYQLVSSVRMGRLARGGAPTCVPRFCPRMVHEDCLPCVASL